MLASHILYEGFHILDDFSALDVQAESLAGWIPMREVPYYRLSVVCGTS